ncbi:MAG: hypothetical protein ABL900_15105 [Burkholderiaceae bacterium]
MTKGISASIGTLWLAALLTMAAPPARAQTPDFLADRGDGLRTSLLATYIRPREFIFYPFYEYTKTSNYEYKASDLGLVGDTDYLGKKVDHEYLIFLGYAFNDSWMLEFESALHAKVKFNKAANDPVTAVPQELRESGLGDTEMQLRWRYSKETETRPEMAFHLQTEFPLQKKKKLLGTQAWGFAVGTVLTKGYSFGTLSLRGQINHDRGDRETKFGEYAIDFLKKLSPQWTIALTLEGEESELSVIGEAQYAISRNAILKLNLGQGLTKKDRQTAPEIGVLFRF